MSYYNCRAQTFKQKLMTLTLPPYNTSLEPKRKQSLAEQVVRDLTERIQGGEFKLGGKLPTEPELMAEQGVSRTVVREAISRLQAAGLVETRHGIGTFVLAPPFGKLPTNPCTVVAIRDVLAMLELRISFETEAAALAASRRTDQHLHAMRTALDAFDAAIAQGETAAEADYQFHLQIAKATDNRYYEDVMSYLGIATIPRTRVNTPTLTDIDGNQYLSKANQDHEQIYDAIRRGDPEAARAAMREHLSGSIQRLGQLNTTS